MFSEVVNSREFFFIVFVIAGLLFIPSVFLVSRFVKEPILRFAYASAVSVILSPIVFICLFIFFALSMIVSSGKN